MMLPLLTACAVSICSSTLPTADHHGSPQDTLHLAPLQARAVARDARTARTALERHSSRLRHDNLGVDLLPLIRLRGDAAYQSEVISIPIDNPSLSLPSPPKERYELAVELDWTVWDGGVTGARRDTESAALDGVIATLDEQLHATEAAVADAFFTALVLQEEIAAIASSLSALERRMAELRLAVGQGVALPGDTAVLGAEILGVQQRRDGLRSQRAVALAELSRLTGHPVSTSEILAVPDMAASLAAVEPSTIATSGALPEVARRHPRFAVFDAQRQARDLQVDIIAATGRPSVSVFSQWAYGNPGYDQFNDSFHDYWRVGTRVQWAPWTWNRRQRQIEELQVQRDLVDNAEQAFTDELLRALQRPIRTIAYLTEALATDDRIVALREEAEAHMRTQLSERAIPLSTYADALSDLEDARLMRARHRVELARAQAHYLTTLGMEIPSP